MNENKHSVLRTTKSVNTPKMHNKTLILTQQNVRVLNEVSNIPLDQVPCGASQPPAVVVDQCMKVNAVEDQTSEAEPKNLSSMKLEVKTKCSQNDVAKDNETKEATSAHKVMRKCSDSEAGCQESNS